MSIVEAVESEYRAARETVAVVDERAREQLRVTGPEAAMFLQGMVTNEVEGLPVGGRCYAAALTAKGAMVGDVRILRRADDFVVDTGPGRGSAIREFLNRYLISEDAELHAAPELAVVGLVGPLARQTVAKLPASAIQGELPAWLGGVEVVVLRDQLEAIFAALEGVPRLSEATREVLRVERGVPVFGVDMTEVTIPLEANLEHAIHYKKGCYIGQEVIARATFRGQMNKKLRPVLLGTQAPEPKTELKVGDRKVGWVTSVVKSPARGENLALAYVHRDFVSAGTTLQLGTAEVRVSDFPTPAATP